MLNLMLAMMMGQHYNPQPQGGESMYDALIQRDRAMHFMRLQQQSFSNNMLFKSLGVANNPYIGALGLLAGSPDSLAGKMMSSGLGGNPMAASMQIYGGLAGGNVMGNFGRTAAITEGETQETMNSLAANFYRRQEYEGPGGLREELVKKAREHIRARVSEGPEGLAYLRSEGLDLSTDAEGNLTQKSMAAVESYDPTPKTPSREAAKKARKTVGAELTQQVNSLLESGDEELTAALNARLEEQLKTHNVATKQQIEAARGANGVLDTQRTKEIIALYEKAGAAPDSPEAQRSRQDIAKKFDAALSTVIGAPLTKKEESQKLSSELLQYNAATPQELTAATDKTTGLLDPVKVKPLVEAYKNLTTVSKSVETRVAIAQKLSESVTSLAAAGTEATPEKLKAGKKVEDLLVDEKIITREKLQELKGNDQNAPLPAATAQKLVSDFVAGPAMGAEPDSALTRVITKRVLSAGLNRKLAALEKATTPETYTEAQAAIEQQLNTEAQLSPTEHAKLKTQEGKYDLPKMRRYTEGLASLSPLEKFAAEAAQIKDAGFKYRGFNFENSRGFKMEDFTGAFYKAADLRLMGNNKNANIADTMSDFSKKAGGALSAARALFGNKSGAELAERISDFIGTSEVNLNSTEGASKVEELLRKTTATARVAGLSIKSMLAIIDATKKLTANNPQLQYMSSAATTEMTLKAVQTAAGLGATMSAADYRSAGGNQGIAADVIRQNVAFAESPLGAGLSALLYENQGNQEGTAKIKKLMASNTITPEWMTNGGLDKLADALGQTRQQVLRTMDTTYSQQEGIKNPEIAKAIYGTAAGTLASTFYEQTAPWLGQASAEKNKADIYAKYAAAAAQGPVDWQKFKAANFSEAMRSPQSALLFKTAERAVQKDLQDSLLPAEYKDKFSKLVEQQTVTDTALAKDLDSSHAAVATQFLDAFMSKKSFDDTADAMSGIISTRNITDPATKAALEGAQEAGRNMLDLLNQSKGDQDAALRNGLGAQISTIVAKRKEAAAASGNTELANKLTATGFTDEQLKNAAEVLPDLGIHSAAKAKELLNTLEKTPEDKLTPANRKSRDALRASEQAGILESDAAHQISIKPGGGVAAFGLAAAQAEAESQRVAILERAKTTYANDLEAKIQLQATDLPEDQGGELARRAKEHYKNIGGAKRMLEDYMNPFNKRDDNFFATRETRNEVAKSKLGEALRETADNLTNVEAQSAAKGEEPPEDKLKKQMIDALTALTSEISGGGMIATALGTLASALFAGPK